VSSEKPVLVAYRPEWPERAALLVSVLGVALGGLADRIDHIGSTAIPQMSAKDVLDLQVSVSNLKAAAPSFDAPLAALGFERSPYEADHVPAGRVDDPDNWAKRLWLRRGHRDGDVNLHLRRTGSPNARLALLFRDWFRAHPEAVPSYSAFKLTLAGIAPDTGTYSDVKDPVVDLVIAVAEAWAAKVGWAP
jgi:GrpB-like predicted nucleotidyltransferase (UPF0157 family)